MKNINEQNRSQLSDLIATFELNAFNWTGGTNETAEMVEEALETEDTTNAVPTVKPAKLKGHHLNRKEMKEVLYSDIHDLYFDIAARDYINEGGTADFTPITPDGFSENELTDMWIDGYRKERGYDQMSEAGQVLFDEEVSDLLKDHPLCILDLHSQLGLLITIWDMLVDIPIYALTLQDGYDKYLIMPEHGSKLENMLFSKSGRAARFWEIAKRRGIAVNIDDRVQPYDVDIDVLRAFAEAYASLNGIQVSDSVLDILSRAAADNAELFALPLDTVQGRALAKMWGIPARPSFADNLALYQEHRVIVMNGNIYRMKPVSIQLA